MVLTRFCTTKSSLCRGWYSIGALVLVLTFASGNARSEAVVDPAGTQAPPADCVVRASDSPSNCPTGKDQYRFEIKPWHPQVEKAKNNEVTTLPELRQAAGQKSEVNFNSVVLTDQKNTNFESDAVNALADFVSERAQAELVLWIVGSVMDDICMNGSGSEFFSNTCYLTKYSEDSSYPSLSGFLNAFRRDMEKIPAAMLCRYYDRDCRGFLLMNLLQGMEAGIDAKYMIAGLAENDEVRCGCRAEYGAGKPGKLCNLYFSSSLMQAYLAGLQEQQNTMRWDLFFARLDAKLGVLGGEMKNAINMDTKNKDSIIRTVHENHYLLADIASNIAKLKELRTSKDIRAKDIMPYAMQVSRDLIALIEKSSESIERLAGVKDHADHVKDREMLEYTMNILSAGSTGRYADVMLDLQKMINEYIKDQCSSDLYPYYRTYGVKQENCETFHGLLETVGEIKRQMSARDCRPAFRMIFENDSTEENPDLATLYQKLSKKNEAYMSELTGFLRNNTGKQTNDIDSTRAAVVRVRRTIKEMDGFIKEYSKSKGLWYAATHWSGPDYCRELLRVTYINDRLKEIEAGLKTVGGTSLSTSLTSTESRQEWADIQTLIEANIGKFDKDLVDKVHTISEKDKKFSELKEIYTLNESVPVVATLATAQSKDEIKSVLSDMSSPLGGWRIKQEKERMYSITALVGYQVAYEKTKNIPQTVGYSTGLMAPIGLDITSNKVKPSIGLLASVLDLGNLVNTRISGTEGSRSADTSVRKVISPGLYLHKGIANTPAVWGIGYAYSPALRAVEVNGEERERGSHRVMLFLSIDASLFYFR